MTAIPHATAGGSAQAPARPPLRKPLSVPYFPALLLCASLMDARRIVALSIDWGAPSWSGALEKLNFLTLFEWACLLRLAATSDFSSLRAGLLERSSFLALALSAAFLVAPQSHGLTILFCVALALRLGFDARLRRLSLCLTLIAVQFALANPLFAKFNDLCIAVDAWAAHWLLLAGGHQNITQGAVFRLVDSPFAVKIYPGCDSLVALSQVACAFAIFVLSSGRGADRLSLLALAVLGVLVVVENWFRLSFMALSYDDYLYWHGGSGAALISAINALAPFLTSEALGRAGQAPAIRRPGQSQSRLWAARRVSGS